MLYKKKLKDNPPLFKAVGCVCILEDKILLLKRVLGKSYPGYWGIPSGKIRQNETSIKAIVRELYEETGILLSNDNLTKINTYHIVNNDMSFLYTLYVSNLKISPKIKLNDKEHTKFDWFTPDNALRLELIPDLDECLSEVFPSLKETNIQLELFTGYSSSIINPTKHLEIGEEEIFNLAGANSNQKEYKDIFVSFGPPGAGKTTFFKELMLRIPQRMLVADNSWAKRNSNIGLFLRKAFEDEQRAFFFHHQMESLFIRYSYTVRAPENSLIDESIYTTLAYSRVLYRLNWIKKYEYEIFHKYYSILFALLPIPKEIIYIDCDVDNLQKRLNKRKRKHESFYSDEYIQALHFAFSEVADELKYKNKFNLVRLNSSKSDPQSLVEEYVSIKTD